MFKGNQLATAQKYPSIGDEAREHVEAAGADDEGEDDEGDGMAVGSDSTEERRADVWWYKEIERDRHVIEVPTGSPGVLHDRPSTHLRQRQRRAFFKTVSEAERNNRCA